LLLYTSALLKCLHALNSVFNWIRQTARDEHKHATLFFFQSIIEEWPKILYTGFDVLSAVVMKSIIFWDIMLCTPLRVNQYFGGIYQLYLQSRALLATCFPAWLILQPWIWRWHVPPQCQLTFNGLYRVLSQKTVLFKTWYVFIIMKYVCFQSKTLHPAP
jgi:hypothetical protein